jgi:hypothetical protein
VLIFENKKPLRSGLKSAENKHDRITQIRLLPACIALQSIAGRCFGVFELYFSL